MHNSISLIICLVDAIGVRGSTKLVNLKEFVLLQPWRRLESGFNVMVNAISDTFPAMGLGF